MYSRLVFTMPLDVIHVTEMYNALKESGSDKVDIVARARFSPYMKKKTEEYLNADFRETLHQLGIVQYIHEGGKHYEYIYTNGIPEGLHISTATRGNVTDIVIFQTFDSCVFDEYSI